MTESNDIRALIRWLEIRAEFGTPFPGSLISLTTDIAHSSLLERLLAGREPLLKPPPKRYSYPWYELVEDGQARLSADYEVFFLSAADSALWSPDRRLVNICQHLWTIVGERDGSFILTYDADPDSRWSLSKEAGCWLLKRLETGTP